MGFSYAQQSAAMFVLMDSAYQLGIKEAFTYKYHNLIRTLILIMQTQLVMCLQLNFVLTLQRQDKEFVSHEPRGCTN